MPIKRRKAKKQTGGRRKNKPVSVVPSPVSSTISEPSFYERNKTGIGLATTMLIASGIGLLGVTAATNANRAANIGVQADQIAFGITNPSYSRPIVEPQRYQPVTFN